MKKVFLTTLMFLGLWGFCTALPVSAAYSGTVLYGGFEEAGKPGVSPTGWSVYDTTWDDGFETSTEYAKEGIFCLKTTAEEGETDTPRAANRSAPYWGYFDTSAKYELSIWVLIPEGSDSKGAYLLPSLYNEDGTETFYTYAKREDHIKGHTNGEWVKTRVVFTPRRSFGALYCVFIRCEPGSVGTIYWDDLQLRKLNADGTYADDVPQKDFSKAEDVLVNGSFSMTDAGGESIASWSASGGWGKAAVVHKNADGAKNGVQLLGQSSYISQQVSAVGGDTFTLHLRYKTDDSGAPAVKFSYRNANGREFTSHATRTLPRTYGKWKDFYYDITVPENTVKVEVLLRKYTDADVFFSAASLYRTRPSPLLTVRTDNDTTFYYTDWKDGTATVTLNTEPTGKTVTFYMKDGESELCRQQMGAEKTLSFAFPVSAMEVKKEYALTVELRDGDAKLLDTAVKSVYCFERPASLLENGQLTKNGETITPVFGYHVQTETELVAAKACGINVVQGIGSYEDGSMGRFLDTCWYTYGIRVFLNLYSGNMLPAGHEINRERTEKIIETYKNHPGLAGYMVQDEPYLQNFYDPESVSRQLLESYRIIRMLDDVHPVYITADIGSSAYYRNIGNACDIIAPDYYPIAGDYEITTIYPNIQEANAAVRGQKPMYAILQIYERSNVRQPTPDELTHMVYQSILAGADAIGYYSFKEGNWTFPSSALYDTLCTFNTTELPLLYDAIQSESTYTDTEENDILLRQYASGTCIAVNVSEEERTYTAVLPEKLTVLCGEAVLTPEKGGGNMKIPGHGRFFGNTELTSFGETLQITGETEKTVKFISDGKKLIPESARLYIAVYTKHAEKRELVGFSVGKAEVTFSVPVKGEKVIEVMMWDSSDGCPIYKKEEITNK